MLLNDKVATSVLASYYTKTEIDASLLLKADKATTELSISSLESSKANVVDVVALQTSLVGMLIDFPETAIFPEPSFLTRTLSFTTPTGVTISGSSFINDNDTNFSPYMAFNKLYSQTNSAEYGWRSGGGFNPKINFLTIF